MQVSLGFVLMCYYFFLPSLIIIFFFRERGASL